MAAAEIQLSEIKHAADIQDQMDNFSPEMESQVEEGKCKRVRKPRRVLHFSDGILEEYSTDEEEEEENKKEQEETRLMNPKSLKWGPWMYYWMLYTGNSALSVCDYVGGGMANILGITSPKFQYEIDEYHRCEEEEKEEREEEAAQMAGWTTTGTPSPADCMKNKIVDSSSLNRSAPEHIETQIATVGETLAVGEVERRNEVKPDTCTAKKNKSSSDEAGDSTHWDRF
ncbi:hypothetical protein Pcinc_016061 [Petrolisthes cinctipes]|uniref:Protein FAM177A1 n=1 Tax=Petrolisthes cinctipes TaxID=88211 RepID=A0AAE1FRT7_PETCI|nr:hypothetical protein Pcinc_016061 [Petrolisthes cinctipes]